MSSQIKTGLLLGLLTAIVFDTAQAAPCQPAGAPVTVAIETIPDAPVAGFDREQLVNAANILLAGADLEVSLRDQAIGVMTAIGESSLRVLDHGDVAGPDSRGLFQQRDNGAWGSESDRMDPYISARNFFTALLAIPGRDELAPTMAAHQVQRNADPTHYAQFWDPAVALIDALAGAPTGLVAGAGQSTCSASPAVPGLVNAEGWAAPAAGPVTSRFGWRIHPVYGDRRLHAGVDLGAGGCGGPIWAVADGWVTFAGPKPGYGNLIEVEHAAGVRTRYGHMYAADILVGAGQDVSAGAQISRAGNAGVSRACHLHFEVLINGEAIDPIPYLHEAGIDL